MEQLNGKLSFLSIHIPSKGKKNKKSALAEFSALHPNVNIEAGISAYAELSAYSVWNICLF